MNLKFHLAVVSLVILGILYLTNIYFWMFAETDLALLLHFLGFIFGAFLLMYSRYQVSKQGNK